MGIFFYILTNEMSASHCHSNKTALRMPLFYIYGEKVNFVSIKNLCIVQICIVLYLASKTKTSNQC